MSIFPRAVCVRAAALLLAPSVGAPASAAEPMNLTIAEVARTARRAVVVIDVVGRDGAAKGLGAGFVVRSDGVIATNLHVIGRARPIRVRFAEDPRTYDAIAVLATDADKDLALIQIDRQDLLALPLGDADDLRVGQPLIAVGNPLGLERSVVDGVLAARRVIDGRDMLELSMRIEPGNSGGPVLDRAGKVVGIVTLKSALADRIGFAVPVNDLAALLRSPRPIPMARWLTIGVLDPKEWTPLMGGTWRQRAGRIIASDPGTNFGGRTLCLSTVDVPEPPFEVAVRVKLDDESGAAGLAFFADGGDNHYGLYPSGGRLRLTRFAGPDRFSWQILAQADSDKYRPQNWNTIKVRIDGAKIIGFVNDEKVIEVEDEAFRTGRVGLVKFREPTAEFKHFRIGRSLPPTAPEPAVVEQINAVADKLSPTGPPDRKIVDALVPHGLVALDVLRDRARAREAEAFRLRHLAGVVHQRRVQDDLTRLFDRDDQDVDLVRAALLLAHLDNEDLDLDPYVRRIDRIAAEVRDGLPDDADEGSRLAALTNHLFNELGFHGSRVDYYHRSNSYLNEVLDDREGLPITLSIVFIELAHRLGLNVAGVGLPGHFVVRYTPKTGDARLIDVFAGGTPMTRAQAREIVRAATGDELADAHLAPVSKRAIIVRMLRNLMRVADGQRDIFGLLRYLDTLVLLAPDSGHDRWTRAMIRSQTAQPAGAIEDLDWLIRHEPDHVDMRRVHELRNLLRRR